MKETQKTVTISVDLLLIERIEAFAAAERRNRSNMIAVLLEEAVTARGYEPKKDEEVQK